MHPSPAPGDHNSWGRSAGYVLAVAFAALAAVAIVGPRASEPLPVLMEVGTFTLTDQNGNPFGTTDLQGRPWVANLFFSSCPSVCPAHMAMLARLQDRLAAEGSPALIVSVSVDPATDTPERLADYGREVGVDSGRWRLLTGDTMAVRHAVESGLKLSMGSPAVAQAHEGHQPGSGQGLYDIPHAAQFLVVDGQGKVRSIVAAGPEALQSMALALAQLARESSRQRRPEAAQGKPIPP